MLITPSFGLASPQIALTSPLALKLSIIIILSLWLTFRTNFPPDVSLWDQNSWRLKRQMATPMKMTQETTVEINGSHENTGPPVMNEPARELT